MLTLFCLIATFALGYFKWSWWLVLFTTPLFYNDAMRHDPARAQRINIAIYALLPLIMWKLGNWISS